MPKYNPNSIWTSKKEEIKYTPPENPAGNWRPAAAGPGKGPPDPASSAPEAGADIQPKEKSYIWWWAGGLFAVLIALGVLFFVLRPPVGPNVNIGFVKPDQVLLGDPFPLSITLSNPSQNILKNAELTITLPDGLAFVGQSAGTHSLQEPVGDIGPGSVYKFNGDGTANLIASGDLSDGNLKHVSVALSYNTDAAPKNLFQTSDGVDIFLQGPAISLTIAPPSSVVSGQDFDTTVTYTNNATDDFSDVKIALVYPPSFSFTGSSMPATDAAHDSFDLGPIPAGGTGTLTVTGNVVGPENAGYPLAANLTGLIAGNTYPLTSGSANFAIAASPLALSVVPNGNAQYVAGLGDIIHYTVSYQNNSPVTFQNVALRATLAGSMFDFSKVTSEGSFNSITDTISWNAANTPALLAIAPGQSGTVDFSVQTKAAYPIHRQGDKNFALDVTAQIASPTVPPGTAASSTVSAAMVENKVGGNLAFAAKAYWRDAAAGILNTGPFPPAVNKPTEYTIHWIITNYATDMGNVTLTASLQSGTACTGVIQSNMSTAPVCDPATGSVTWTIPTIPATMGVVGPAAEAVIQVKNTPAVNQVGSTVTLMGPTSLTATDLFASSTFTATAPAITTALPDDATVYGKSGTVTQ